MQLSLRADYALRVLIYLGSHPSNSASTAEISNAYGISKHHLVRVVQLLGQHGLVKLVPGRFGGITLTANPADIRLGDVLKAAEPNLRLVECFDEATNTCPITAVCGLKSYLREAIEAFITNLNRHTLADLLTTGRKKKLSEVLVQFSK